MHIFKSVLPMCILYVCVSPQVSDTLKKFAVKVTTASVKERKEIFGELKLCIKSKGERGLLCVIELLFVVLC